MAEDIQFETPENVRVTYRAAGPGTRFVAWVIDNLLLTVVCVVLAVPMAILFAAALEYFGSIFDDSDDPQHLSYYVLGLFYALYSLSGLLYFGFSEILLRGQTFGKRQMRIRVVKLNGFALDANSILVRTIFRVIDHLPPLWIVPVFTPRSQRLGDVVAGTIVVSEDEPESIGMRELANRAPADCRFRFDVTALGRLRPQDVVAIENILERWITLSDAERDAFLDRVFPPLVARLQVDMPEPIERQQFLEDLLAAEYRRQYRKLG